MLTNLLISFVIAVALMVLGALLDPSFRYNGKVDRRLAACRCPSCNAPYGAQAATSGSLLVHSHGPNTRELTCPECRYRAEWNEDGSLVTGKPEHL